MLCNDEFVSRTATLFCHNKASECRVACLSVGKAGVFVLFPVVDEINVAKELSSCSIVSGECGLITSARENISNLLQTFSLHEGL